MKYVLTVTKVALLVVVTARRATPALFAPILISDVCLYLEIRHYSNDPGAKMTECTFYGTNAGKLVKVCTGSRLSVSDLG